MARNFPPELERIYSALDRHLTYHVGLIINYADRNPISELHEKHLGDPIFEKFGLTDISFAQKRWAAGFANSCATNLGRFTDKAAKAILISAFGLSAEQVLKRVKIRSNHRTEIEETDGVILADEVSPGHRDKVVRLAKRLGSQLPGPQPTDGLGFEFRGRYGKNDDTLIQKDEHMAAAITELGAVPVLAMFSTCNAAGAMARLKRSWVITAGHETIELLDELTGVDLMAYLRDREELLRPVVALTRSPPKDQAQLERALATAEERTARLA